LWYSAEWLERPPVVGRPGSVGTIPWPSRPKRP